MQCLTGLGALRTAIGRIGALHIGTLQMGTLCISAFRAARVPAVLFLLGLAGCVSASPRPAPDPPTAAAPSINVLVVDVQADSSRRHAWEAAIVSALQRRQIAATPSYRLFPLMAPPVTDLTPIVLERRFSHVLALHFSPTGIGRWPDRFDNTGYRWLQRYDRYWHVAYGPDGAESGAPVDYQTDIFTVYFAGSSAFWTATTTPLQTGGNLRGNLRTASAQISEWFVEALR